MLLVRVCACLLCDALGCGAAEESRLFRFKSASPAQHHGGVAITMSCSTPCTARTAGSVVEARPGTHTLFAQVMHLFGHRSALGGSRVDAAIQALLAAQIQRLASAQSLLQDAAARLRADPLDAQAWHQLSAPQLDTVNGASGAGLPEPHLQDICTRMTQPPHPAEQTQGTPLESSAQLPATAASSALSAPAAAQPAVTPSPALHRQAVRAYSYKSRCVVVAVGGGGPTTRVESGVLVLLRARIAELQAQVHAGGSAAGDASSSAARRVSITKLCAILERLQSVSLDDSRAWNSLREDFGAEGSGLQPSAFAALVEGMTAGGDGDDDEEEDEDEDGQNEAYRAALRAEVRKEHAAASTTPASPTTVAAVAAAAASSSSSSSSSFSSCSSSSSWESQLELSLWTAQGAAAPAPEAEDLLSATSLMVRGLASFMAPHPSALYAQVAATEDARNRARLATTAATAATNIDAASNTATPAAAPVAAEKDVRPERAVMQLLHARRLELEQQSGVESAEQAQQLSEIISLRCVSSLNARSWHLLRASHFSAPGSGVQQQDTLRRIMDQLER